MLSLARLRAPRVLAVVVGALAVLALTAWLLHGKWGEAQANSLEIKSALLPEDCEIAVSLSLAQLLKSASAHQNAANVAFAGALAGARQGKQVVDQVLSLTAHGQLSDLDSFRICSSRSRASFVAALTGQVRPNALGHLETLGWQRIEIAGVATIAGKERRPPFYVQAKDGSLLVASDESSLTRAIEQALHGTAASPSAQNSTISAVIKLGPSPTKHMPGQARSPFEVAQRVRLSADFEQRQAHAEFDVSSADQADLLGKKLRATLEEVSAGTGDPRGGNAGSGLVYMARRSRVTIDGQTVLLDADLSDDAIDWLIHEMMKRVGTR